LVSHGTFADPGYNPGDAAAVNGFAAQLGFRVPNIIISPFTRRHYVSHTPMDHTAVIKFVENRLISPSASSRTATPHSPIYWNSLISPAFHGHTPCASGARNWITVYARHDAVKAMEPRACY